MRQEVSLQIALLYKAFTALVTCKIPHAGMYTLVGHQVWFRRKTKAHNNVHIYQLNILQK